MRDILLEEFNYIYSIIDDFDRIEELMLFVKSNDRRFNIFKFINSNNTWDKETIEIMLLDYYKDILRDEKINKII